MRLRHSELKDGGLGALAVSILEEALGVVIQVVVLKAVEQQVQQAGVGGKDGAHMQGGALVSGACAAWQHGRAWSRAWQSMEQSVAEHGRAGQSAAESTLDCR